METEGQIARRNDPNRCFAVSIWDDGDYCVTGREPGDPIWQETPLWGNLLSRDKADTVAKWLNSLAPEYLDALAKLFPIIAEAKRAAKNHQGETN